MLWILTEVLDAGVGGTVIGYVSCIHLRYCHVKLYIYIYLYIKLTLLIFAQNWNPANILRDVATLATSDRNKPLLVDFVLQLIRALELRSDNHRAVKMAITALSQLSFEPACKPKFDMYKERLNTCLDMIVTDFPTGEADLKRNAQVLKAAMNKVDKPATTIATSRQPSSFRKLAQAALGVSRASAPAPKSAAAGPGPGAGASAVPETTATNNTKHVMISYQWDSQPIAIEIEKRLSRSGVKTWFDLNDVGYMRTPPFLYKENYTELTKNITRWAIIAPTQWHLRLKMRKLWWFCLVINSECPYYLILCFINNELILQHIYTYVVRRVPIVEEKPKWLTIWD